MKSTELDVVRIVMNGDYPSVHLLGKIEDEEFLTLIFKKFLKKRFSSLDPYLSHEALFKPLSLALTSAFGEKLPRGYWERDAIKALTAEARLTLMKIFPGDANLLGIGIKPETVIEIIREQVKTDSGYEAFKYDLSGFLTNYGSDDEIVKIAFSREQSLSWLPVYGKTGLEKVREYTRLFENEEQVLKTFEGKNLTDYSDRAAIVFEVSKVIPAELLVKAFSYANAAGITAYMKALESNPAAATVFHNLQEAAASARPLPGRPSLEKVEEMKRLRARTKRNEPSTEYQTLELENLSYSYPYALKLKALERAKSQEASGELNDPFKVVELENLIERIEATIAVREIRKYVSTLI